MNLIHNNNNNRRRRRIGIRISTMRKGGRRRKVGENTEKGGVSMAAEVRSTVRRERHRGDDFRIYFLHCFSILKP